MSDENIKITIQNCLMYTFCSLEYLTKKTQITNEDSVQICLNYMKRYLNPHKNDFIQDPKLLICIISFLWENLIYSDDNLKTFLISGGIFTLLDILNVLYILYPFPSVLIYSYFRHLYSELK